MAHFLAQYSHPTPKQLHNMKTPKQILKLNVKTTFLLHDKQVRAIYTFISQYTLGTRLYNIKDYRRAQVYGYEQTSWLTWLKFGSTFL